MKRLLPLLLLLTMPSWAFAAWSNGGSVPPTIVVANEGATGTTLNALAKLTGAPSTAIVTAITDTGGAQGVCTAGCGITSNATITTQGLLNCIFDGNTIAGHYVQISGSVAGDCHDTGATTYPSSGQAIGKVMATANGGAGQQVQINLFPPEIQPVAGGTVTNVTGTSPITSSGGATPAIGIGAPYGATSYTAHGVVVGAGASNLTVTGACATGTFVYGQGASADPICSTLVMPNAATTGDLLEATSSNTIGRAADVAIGQVWESGGVGATGAYGKVTSGHVDTTVNTVPYIYSANGTNSVSNSVTETSMWSFSLSGGVLGSTNNVVHCWSQGEYLQNATGSQTVSFKFYYGTNNYVIAGPAAQTQSATPYPFQMDVWLGARGATNTQYVYSIFRLFTTTSNAGTGNEAVEINSRDNGMGTDSTVSQTVKVTATMSSNTATQSVTDFMAYCEVE